MKRLAKRTDQEATRLRILFLTYYFFPHVGGATWTAYNISNELKKRGHCVLLLAPYIVALPVSRSGIKSFDSEFFSIDRYPIPRIIAPVVASFRNFCRAASVLKRKRFDVILVQYHPHHFNFPFALLLARIFQLPIIVKADDVYRDMGVSENLIRNLAVRMLNTLNERLIGFSDLFLIVDTQNRRTLHSRRPEIAMSKLQLSPNGFNPVSDTTSSQLVRGNSRTIVLVGRFSGAEYGLGLLLNAMRLVVEKIPNAKLELVGDELSKSWKREIDKMGLNQNVAVYPPTYQNNVAKIIAGSAVCVGPLFATQTTPLKVLEYMAHGKPVVSGIHSISSDLAINGQNCLLVKADSTEIANAIVKLLSDKEFAARIGKNALLSVEKFSWEHIVKDMIDKFYAALRIPIHNVEV